MRNRGSTFRNARCLVTGASSGLGRAFAVLLAREGAGLVLTGRSEDRLEATARAAREAGAAENAIRVVRADLTSAADRSRLFQATAEHFSGALDLVINSAGVGAYGRMETHDEAVLRQVFEINVFALAAVCRGALPLLRRGRRPSVINIGSIVARRGLPGRSEYSASKHAVAGLTESLRAEWCIDGIHVLLVNPSFTATEFEEHLIVDTALYQVSHHRKMAPETVAAAALRALRSGKHELTLSAPGRLLLLVNRFFPRLVDRGLGLWAKRLYARAATVRCDGPGIREPSSPGTLVKPTRTGR